MCILIHYMSIFGLALQAYDLTLAQIPQELSFSHDLRALMYWGQTQFTLPEITDDSETLYLLQYSTWGHHSLAFYRDGQLIEFTYGDWALFALDKRDLWTAFSHMLWPTLGALGRKVEPWVEGEAICPLFTDCQDVVPFPAPALLAQKLFVKLQRAYESRIKDQILHKQDTVYFVPYSVAYGVWNNCNHELAKWLVQLNGQVHGRVFYQPDFIKGMNPPLPSAP